MSSQLNEYIAANQSLQERLIASVREISTLKQEVARLNQQIASAAALAPTPENVVLSIVEDEPAEQVVAKTKTSPEITVDMSDI